MDIKQRGGGRWVLWGGTGLAVVLAGVMVQSTTAYPRYRENDQEPFGYCVTCHGQFNDDTSPQGTQFPNGGKHNMHRASSYMNTECTLCHIQVGDNPLTNDSTGTPDTPGLGCIGCHGRDYPGIGVRGAGLRLHHFNNNVTLCLECKVHMNDPVPLPEDVNPLYYGSVDTNVDDSCNAPPDLLENWSDDVDNTRGLDNDGDNDYDQDDSDCAADPCPWDLTDDGFVGINDLLILLANWGPNPGHPADFNGDDFVGINDLLVLLANWGNCPG
ncbi:MAG: hypothetical protein ACYS0G_10810 [Planctomycetota bacterium]|jgi:hypothetical protein